METSIKLSVDFNNADTEGKVRLNTVGTFRDLKTNNVKLENGLKVLLYDDDLEALGIVEFSENESIWVAKIDWNIL
jgi:hypothetical protein